MIGVTKKEIVILTSPVNAVKMNVTYTLSE
jgi:hypothetical protein